MISQEYYETSEIRESMQNQMRDTPSFTVKSSAPDAANNNNQKSGIMGSGAILKSRKSKAEDIDMTREELDAKLAQNKAEVQAIASGMREEMAHWREEQNAQMNKVITTLSVLDVKLDERYENQKTASTRTQWLIGLAIAVAAIIPAVIALVK
ncbi:hypothetical protein [Morganella morganii]|uniref:hypothetical protein n=1 Tax=Morganella morganii TaxID=582 RepID=UPI00128D6201|nr:hypothetical protein [Morganella morganii]MQC08097.1 hypothetical protein [Morganella morganii]MQC10047.1 hypothetical protein [Morganella morganii]MQC13288.1 hypothetical protein [Morganella morganii]